jgi:hypothetical protein
MRKVLALVAMLALTGCSKKVEIVSNGCWSGTVGSSNVEGCGNRTYTLRGEPKCATLHLKSAVDGTPDSLTFLRMRVKGKEWSEVRDAADAPEITVCD